MLLLCAILLLAVTIDPAAIPEVLRRKPRWVLWRSIQKPGKPKPSKVPFR
jgi:primase-polymerase (primpol)-like protein